MAVQQVTSTKRFLGTSADQKPVRGGDFGTLPDGSTFTETDTGATWTWDGDRWLPPQRAAAGPADPTELLTEIRDLLQKLAPQ